MYIDNKIANILVQRTDIFAHIHPTFLTVISLICNVLLYRLVAPSLDGHTQMNVGALAVVVLVRCLTDILDGAVARKYNKTSQIGGLLDTLGDVTLLLLVVAYICARFALPWSICWIVALAIGYVLYRLDMYHNHAPAKVYDGHVGQQLLAFCTNNTVILFIVGYFGVLSLSSSASPIFEGIKLRHV